MESSGIQTKGFIFEIEADLNSKITFMIDEKNMNIVFHKY